MHGAVFTIAKEGDEELNLLTLNNCRRESMEDDIKQPKQSWWMSRIWAHVRRH
jgi:hypothetical protein